MKKVAPKGLFAWEGGGVEKLFDKIWFQQHFYYGGASLNYLTYCNVDRKRFLICWIFFLKIETRVSGDGSSDSRRTGEALILIKRVWGGGARSSYRALNPNTTEEPARVESSLLPLTLVRTRALGNWGCHHTCSVEMDWATMSDRDPEQLFWKCGLRMRPKQQVSQCKELLMSEQIFVENMFHNKWGLLTLYRPTRSKGERYEEGERHPKKSWLCISAAAIMVLKTAMTVIIFSAREDGQSM